MLLSRSRLRQLMRQAPQLDFPLVQQFNLCSLDHKDCCLHPSLYNSPPLGPFHVHFCLYKAAQLRKRHMTNMVPRAVHDSNLHSKEGYVGVGEHKDPTSWKINELHSCCQFFRDYPLYHLRKPLCLRCDPSLCCSEFSFTLC